MKTKIAVAGFIVLLLLVAVLFFLQERLSIESIETSGAPGRVTTSTQPVKPAGAVARTRSLPGSGEREGRPGNVGSTGVSAQEPVRGASAPTPATNTAAKVEEEKAILLKADDVVAMIGGKPLRARDLCVYGKGAESAVQAFSPAEFDLVLERAVRKVLVLRAAENAGVELTNEQKAHLEQVRATVEKRQGQDANAIFLTLKGTVQEQADFEVNDAAAILLQNALLEHAGIGTPYVTEDVVVQHYTSHMKDYEPLPQDPEGREVTWARIANKIRDELAPEVMRKYEANRTAFFERLANEAGVQILPVDRYQK